MTVNLSKSFVFKSFPHSGQIGGLPRSHSHTACTKMAVTLAWILTHFQGGFQSHSSRVCNTEEKQDTVTRSLLFPPGRGSLYRWASSGMWERITWKSSCPWQQTKTIQAYAYLPTLHIHTPTQLTASNTQVTNSLSHGVLITSIQQDPQCVILQLLHNFQHITASLTKYWVTLITFAFIINLAPSLCVSVSHMVCLFRPR